MRPLVLLLFVRGLLGCHYQPGSFEYPERTFPGQRATIGCLDISVDRRADMDNAAVLDYQFGNRCEKPVTIDLGSVPVYARTSGDEVSLTLFDPGVEVKATQIDALQAGGEALAYYGDADMLQVCADVSRIEQSTKLRDAHWLCFGRKPTTNIAMVTP